MKTITGFLANENNYCLLTIGELISVKGGDDPENGDLDPFKKKKHKDLHKNSAYNTGKF